MTVRIVSWNILQGGGKRIDGICDAITDLAPDILVLQEYRNGRASDALLICLDRLGLSEQHLPNSEARKNAVLLASRYPMTTSAWDDSLDPSLSVRADFSINGLVFRMLAGHLPHKREQVAYLNVLLESADLLEQPSMIIGDLNCGIPFEDSDTRTFDNTHMFQALLKQGWHDSWRQRNGNAREFSWVSPKGNGYRYDHCLSSVSLDARIDSIRYAHDVREAGLSDHSALIVELH